MQIFLSHSSHQKPLIREIKKSLPAHLNPWIDEERLLIGDKVDTSIEATIAAETDYVLLFIDEHAAASSWVRKEIDWTLQAEKRLRRTILLPIVIEAGALERLNHFEISQRKYLSLRDYLEPSVRGLSDQIAAELFALVCRDVHHLQHPTEKTAIDTIADAERLLHAQATIIRKTVFPHRKSNPISRIKLLEILNAYNDSDSITEDQFDLILASVIQRNLVPGLCFDGDDAYLVEEHASWKAELQRQKKEAIGKKVISLIKNGMNLFIDAGSTTEEVVRLLCKRIENRVITRVTIATTSVNIADMISDCCVKMGFDDEFSAVRLYIPGGQVRPNTQAIVSLKDIGPRQLVALSDHVGGFDLGMVGVNGVDIEAGFTTHENGEASNKSDILATSRRKVIVGDSSKLGIVLEHRFSSFEDDITFVVDDDKANPKLADVMSRYASKMLLA